MAQFWIALSWAGLGLETVVAAAILKNQWREFTLFLAYVIASVAATLVVASYLYLPHTVASYATIYWLLNVSLDGLVVAVIVNLIYRALNDQGVQARLLCAATLVLFVSIPVAAAYDRRFGFWMTASMRNLSFGAEILNIVLWMVLVRTRAVGSRFLWVSAGIGIQVTGQVMAHSLRLLSSHTAIWAPNLLLNMSQFTALLMWLYAFCRADSVKQIMPGPYAPMQMGRAGRA